MAGRTAQNLGQFGRKPHRNQVWLLARPAIIVFMCAVMCLFAGGAFASDIKLVNPQGLVQVSPAAMGGLYIVNGLVQGADKVVVNVYAGATPTGVPTVYTAVVAHGAFEAGWVTKGLAPGQYTVQAVATLNGATVATSAAATVNIEDVDPTTNLTEFGGALTLMAGTAVNPILIGKDNNVVGTNLQLASILTATNLQSIKVPAGVPTQTVVRGDISVDGAAFKSFDFSPVKLQRLLNETDGNASPKGAPFLLSIPVASLTQTPNPETLTILFKLSTPAPNDTVTYSRAFIFDNINPTGLANASAWPSAGKLRVSGVTQDANGVRSVSVAVKKLGVTLQTLDATVTPGTLFGDPATWTVDITGLAAGDYKITSTSTDNAGNVQTVTTDFPVTVKATPTFTLTVAGLSPAAAKGKVFKSADTIIDALVTAPTLGVTWKVTLNGKDVTNTGTATHFTATAPAGDGPAHIVVVATDDQNNVSVTTTDVTTADVIIDDTKPTVVLTAPKANDFVDATNGIKVTGTVNDVNPKNYTVSIVEIPGFTPVTNAGTGINVTIPASAFAGQATGPFTIRVTAKDLASDPNGNVSANTDVSVKWVKDPPTPTITSTFASPVRAPQTINFDLGTANVASWQLLDGTTEIDGGAASASSSTWNPPVDQRMVSHSLTLKVTDKSGRSATSPAVTVTVNTLPPVVTIGVTSPKPGAIVKGPITIAGVVDESATTQLYVDGVATGSTQSGTTFNFSVTPAKDGAHDFLVIATDPTGNVSKSVTTASVSAIADNGKPTVQIVPPSGATFTNDGSTPGKAVVVLPKQLLEASVTDDFGVGGHLSASPPDSKFFFEAVDINGNATGTNDTEFPLVLAGGATSFALPGVFTTGLVRLTVTGYDRATDSTGAVSTPNQSVPAVIYLSIGTPAVSITDLLRSDGSKVIAATDGNYYVNGIIRANGIVAITDLKSWVLEPYQNNVLVTIFGSPSSGTLGSGTTQLATASEITVHPDGSDMPWNTDVQDVNGKHISDGAYALRLTATDKSNNKTPFSLPVVIDNTPPVVAFTAPPANGVIGGDNVHIKATITEANLASYSLKDGATVLETKSFGPGQNGFSVDFNWQTKAQAVTEAQHVLSIVATDLSGNTTIVTQTVTVDNTAPTVTVTDPKDGLVYNPKAGALVPVTVHVKGTITDLNNLSDWNVLVDGTKQPKNNGTPDPDPHASPFTFDYTLAALLEGPHVITVEGFDKANTPNPSDQNAKPNRGVSSPGINVTVDTTNPVPKFTSTFTGTQKGTITITATITETNPKQWELRDTNGSVITSGTTETNISYQWVTPASDDHVTHTLTLWARDAAGNESSPNATLSVTVDNVPPVVTISSSVPVEGGIYRQRINVSGKITDGAGAANIKGQLFIDGVADGAKFGVAADGSFATSTSAALSPNGIHTITVHGYDELNESISSERHIISDNTAPDVSIVPPKSSTPTNDGSTRSNPVSVQPNETLFANISDQYGVDITTNPAYATGIKSHANFTFVELDSNGQAVQGTTLSFDPLVVFGSSPFFGQTSQTMPPQYVPVTGHVVMLTVTGWDVAVPTSPPIDPKRLWADGNPASKVIYLVPGKPTIQITDLFLADGTKVNPAGDGNYYLRGLVRANGIVDKANLKSWVLEAYQNNVLVTIFGAPPSGTLGSGTSPLPTVSELTIRTDGGDMPWNTDIVSNGKHISDGAYELRLTETGTDNSTQPFSLPVFIDNTPPVLSISSPTDMLVVGGKTVAVSASITEDHIASYRLTDDVGNTIDSGTFPAGQKNQTINKTWDTVTNTNKVPDGQHVLTLTCTDLAGTTVTITRTVIVDNTNPVVTIDVSPTRHDTLDVPPGPYNFVIGPFKVTGTVTDATVDPSKPIVHPAKIELFLDGKLAAASPDDPSAMFHDQNHQPTSYNVANVRDPMEKLGEGDHTFVLKATDMAGNVSATDEKSGTIRVDTYAPNPHLTAPAPDTLVSGNAVMLSGTIMNDPINKPEANPDFWQLFVDANLIPEPASNDHKAAFTGAMWDASTYSDGPHFVTIRASDRSGQTGTSTPVRVYVSNKPAHVTILSPIQTGRPLVVQAVKNPDGTVTSVLPIEFKIDTSVPMNVNPIDVTVSVNTSAAPGGYVLTTRHLNDATTTYDSLLINQDVSKVANRFADIYLVVSAKDSLGHVQTQIVYPIYIGTLGAKISMPTAAVKDGEQQWMDATDHSLRAYVAGNFTAVTTANYWSRYTLFDQFNSVLATIIDYPTNPLPPNTVAHSAPAQIVQDVVTWPPFFAEGRHQLTFQAYDDQGYVEPTVTPAVLDVTIDRTPPIVTIVSPNSGTVVAPNSILTLTFQITDRGASSGRSPLARLLDTTKTPAVLGSEPRATVVLTPFTATTQHPQLSLIRALRQPSQTNYNGAATISSQGTNPTVYTITWQLPINADTYGYGGHYTLTISDVADIVGNSAAPQSVTFTVGSR